MEAVAGNLGGLQGCCEVCSEKIRKGKAQPELNLATVIKDNKNISINILARKGRLKRISFIGSKGKAWGEKGEERAEILHVYFASVFNKNYCSLGTQHPERHRTQPGQLTSTA